MALTLTRPRHSDSRPNEQRSVTPAEPSSRWNQVRKAADDRRQRNGDRCDDQQHVERRQEAHCEEVADFLDHCPHLLLTFESSLNPTSEKRPYWRKRKNAALSRFMARRNRPANR